MFSYILWGLIILVMIIIAKRLLEGAVLGIVYILLVFFAVFLLDTITPFPLRNVISLEWYDDTLEDPGGAINTTVDKAKGVGSKAVDNVNEIGKNLDVYYGTELDKEWKVKESEIKEQEQGNKVDKKVEKDKKIEKDKTGDMGEQKEGEKEFIKYRDVGKKLRNEYKNLPKGDKDILRAMTSVYKTRFKGESIEVWNTEGESTEGFYMIYKGD